VRFDLHNRGTFQTEQELEGGGVHSGKGKRGGGVIKLKKRFSGGEFEGAGVFRRCKNIRCGGRPPKKSTFDGLKKNPRKTGGQFLTICLEGIVQPLHVFRSHAEATKCANVTKKKKTRIAVRKPSRGERRKKSKRRERGGKKKEDDA